jgi:hypothetical protein
MGTPHPFEPWLLPVTAGWLPSPAQLFRRTHPLLPLPARWVPLDTELRARAGQAGHARPRSAQPTLLGSWPDAVISATARLRVPLGEVHRLKRLAEEPRCGDAL